MQITVSETIHAPIDRVFAVATNIPDAAETVRGINSIEVLEEAPHADNNNGVVGKGFKWRETRTMFGKQATEDMWITEWTPPEGYWVEARSHGCHYVSSFTFEDLGSSSTRMTMSFDGTPETFGAKVMMKIFSFMNKKLTQCLVDDLADIKSICEAAAPDSGGGSSPGTG